MKIFFLHIGLSILTSYVLYHFYVQEWTGIGQALTYLAVYLLISISMTLFKRTYLRQFYYGIRLFLFFLKELITSNLEIVYYVITPGLQFKSAIIALPLDLKDDYEIVLLANMITLTPGTLSLEVSSDKKYLFYHAMNVPKDDVELAKQQMKDGFEKRIIALRS